jgi:hypothetical protein
MPVQIALQYGKFKTVIKVPAELIVLLLLMLVR